MALFNFIKMLIDNKMNCLFINLYGDEIISVLKP